MEKSDKKPEEKKKNSTFSLIIGLILLIIAVGLVLMKNGVNLFGKGETPEEKLVSASQDLFDDINEEVLEYLAYCGDNARANDGTLSVETVVDTEKKLESADDSIIGSLIGAIGLDKVSVTESYSLKDTDGLITVVRASDDKTVYNKETLLYGMDFSRFGKASALKEKVIKKLLVYYEKMFIEELVKDGYDYVQDSIVNLDSVLLDESCYTIDYSNEDLTAALEAVLADMAKNKKWIKAFEAMSDGDMDEYMDRVEEALTGAESWLGAINDIKGNIYVTNNGALNYVELTFDVDDESIEEKLKEKTGWIVSKAIDVDPVFTLSFGYTALSDSRGFKFSIVNSENVVRIDVTGHGTVEKTGIFDGTVAGFTGTADLEIEGVSGSISIADAQIIDLDRGCRLNGVFALTFDKNGIVIEAGGTNAEQDFSYSVSLNSKKYMSGKVNFTDK